MLDERFIFVAIALNLLGGFSYLKDTISGKAKPNRVSWLLWGLAPLIAFAAEIYQGVGIASLLTFIVGFNPLLIFIASFINKKSQWKITKFDLICGVLSIMGIICWMLTQEGDMAILFAILADALAGVPTIIKSYKAPETESYKIYLFGSIGAFITLLTIRQWNFAYVAFPLYILVISFVLFLLIKFKLGKRI